MENTDKRELKNYYKNKEKIGGIYCIQCGENGRMWVKSTRDMVGQKNKFEFSISINSCPEPGMLAEWNKYGAKSFHFAILEEIVKKEMQTEREFKEDIDVLLELWLEKHRKDETQRGDENGAETEY